MKLRLSCLALALALWPAAASASEQAVVLNDGSLVARGYCVGTISASTHTTATLAIDACHDGGIKGVTAGQTHSFPKTQVHAAKPGQAMAAARTRFFASPLIVTILHGRYVPAATDDFTALAALADQGGLDDWRAFFGLLLPVTTLHKVLYAKSVSAYDAHDFAQAMHAYRRYGAAEIAAIRTFAAATPRRPPVTPANDPAIAGNRSLPDFGAVMLVQLAGSDYHLPFNSNLPDAWLKLQLRASSTTSTLLKAYRRAMAPLGLNTFFATEMQRMQLSNAQIRRAAQRTYTKVAKLKALGVLNDAEYAKPDAAVLADVERVLKPYTHARRTALAAVKARLAYSRKQIAATERILAAMKGRQWQLNLTETDGDPPRNYVMMFARTGAYALEARIYEKDLQYGNLIKVLTWPVYVHINGDVLVNSGVNGPVENPFVIPAAAFSRGRFHVRSEGSTEIFFARGTLSRTAKKH